MQKRKAISLGYRIISLALMAVALFTSCVETISEKKKEITVGEGYENFETDGKGGSLTVTARVSNGASRYAMPSPIISEFDYAALLYPPENENFVKGEEVEGKLTFSFQSPDVTSGLTLEIFAFKKDTDTADFSRGSALLFGKTKDSLTVSDGSDKIEVNEIIALEMNEESDESGTVYLEIKLPDGYTLDIDDKDNFTCNKKEGGTSNIYVIEEKTQDGEDGIPAKAYPVTFIVMYGEKTVRVFPEHINVLHGMRTDTWGGLTKGGAKEIKITNSISTSFFVRGTGEGWYTENGYASIKGDDDNSGSFLAPFATIQKAVDAVIAQNDGTSKYTIYVDGTLTQNEAPSGNGMADFFALAKNLNLTITALSENTKATLNANKLSRVIYANPTSGVLKLTMKNLIVKNGFTRETECGGGIYFGSTTDGTLTVEGCTIIGNTASQDGGGVYITGGTFTMEDGTIGTVNDENTAKFGGGVYIAGNGKFIMNKGYISGNKTEGDNFSGGGGVNVFEGTFEMNGGEISENIASGSSFGGGGVHVFTDQEFTMTGGIISGNKAATNYGAGIYLNNSKLNISDTAKIESDNDVYLNNDSQDSILICVVGTLSETKVATITPNAYTVDRQVLIAGDGVTIDEDICKKFTVTSQDDGTEWEIVPSEDGAGVLSKVRVYALGDTGPGGGVVFYKSEEGFTVNGKTCHYLECSKEPLKIKVIENEEEKEISTVKWCPYPEDGSGKPCTCEVNTFDGIGAGWANTQAIIEHQNHTGLSESECAAWACKKYSPNSATTGDWFLPSVLEAEEMSYYISDYLENQREECWTSTTISNTNSDSNDGKELAFVVIFKLITYPEEKVEFERESKPKFYGNFNVRPVHAF